MYWLISANLLSRDCTEHWTVKSLYVLTTSLYADVMSLGLYFLSALTFLCLLLGMSYWRMPGGKGFLLLSGTAPLWSPGSRYKDISHHPSHRAVMSTALMISMIIITQITGGGIRMTIIRIITYSL